MRLEIPDGFNVQPLLSAMKREAEAQSCELHGKYDGRDLVLIVRSQIEADEPSPQIAMNLPSTSPAHTTAALTLTGRGVELLTALDDPRNVIVNLNQYRAARGLGVSGSVRQ